MLVDKYRHYYFQDLLFDVYISLYTYVKEV